MSMIGKTLAHWTITVQSLEPGQRKELFAAAAVCYLPIEHLRRKSVKIRGMVFLSVDFV